MFSIGGEAIDGAIASIAAHAQSEDASAFFAEVESGLAELDEEAAQRFADDFEALRSGRLAGTAFLSLTRRFSRASMPGFREEANHALAGLARATLGSVLVEFEQGARDAVAHTQRGDADYYAALLTIEHSSLRRVVDEALLQLYSAAAAGTDLVGPAHAVERAVARGLTGFARLQGFAYRSTVVARHHGRGMKAETLGEALAVAGLTTRECIAYRVAAARVAVEFASGAPSKTVGSLVAAARERGFDPQPPKFGRKVSIPKLPELEDGSEVETAGFVVATQVTRKDTGPLSIVVLEDPSSGTATLVAAFFAHLPHAGVSKGAYLRVRGVYREASGMLAGRAGVEVRRLKLASVGVESWKTEMMRTARRWYQPFRGSLDLAWGLGRHGDAADRRGAAELVFSPTDRSRS